MRVKRQHPELRQAPRGVEDGLVPEMNSVKHPQGETKVAFRPGQVTAIPENLQAAIKGGPSALSTSYRRRFFRR
jgi:hypothetical protein